MQIDFSLGGHMVLSPIRATNRPAATDTSVADVLEECDLCSDENMNLLKDVLAVSVDVTGYRSTDSASVPTGIVFTPEKIKACSIRNERATHPSIPFSFVFLLRYMMSILLVVCSLFRYKRSLP